MNTESHNVNVSLEAEFFSYYHKFYLDVLADIQLFVDGEISEHELTGRVEEIRAEGLKQEAKLMDKYEYLRRNYEVGGILRAWYLRSAH